MTAVSGTMLADLSPALLVLCPRPRSKLGASRRVRFVARDPGPLVAMPLLVADGGGIWADGGRFAAESDGDEFAELAPVAPFIVVWIFSGRFNLLIAQAPMEDLNRESL